MISMIRSSQQQRIVRHSMRHSRRFASFFVEKIVHPIFAPQPKIRLNPAGSAFSNECKKRDNFQVFEKQRRRRVLRVVFSLTVSVFVPGADSSTSNPRIVRSVFFHHYHASSLSAVDQQKCSLLAAAECQDRTDDLRIMRPTL